jgi:hypothetical protein
MTAKIGGSVAEMKSPTAARRKAPQWRERIGILELWVVGIA